MALPNFPITDTVTQGNSFSATTVIDATASETVILPSGRFASFALYSQHGTDQHLTGPDGETKQTISDEDLEQLAATLTDVAPAAGPEADIIEETDFEEMDETLVKTFGVEGGFEAETIASVTVAETTETDNDQTTAVVTEETAPVDAAPEIDGLTAHSVQAKPQLVSHDLATTTQIDGVHMDDLAIANDHPVTLTFMNEGAGYRSTVGYYKIPKNGEIANVDVIFENASKVGSGGNLIPGVSAVNLDVQAGDKIAFFIVANGFRRNDFDDFVDGSYVFRDSQDTATTGSVSPDLFMRTAKRPNSRATSIIRPNMKAQSS